MSLREVQESIQAQLRKLPKIDEQGRPIVAAPPTPDPVTATNLLATLMDSVSFQEKASQLDPNDTGAMQALIQSHVNPRPKMQQNPLQGGGTAAQPPKPKMTFLESLASQFSPPDPFERPGQSPIV